MLYAVELYMGMQSSPHFRSQIDGHVHFGYNCKRMTAALQSTISQFKQVKLHLSTLWSTGSYAAG